MDSNSEMVACQLCFPGAVDYGELVPGFFLINHEDGWFIINADGHDKLFYLEGKPYPEPLDDDMDWDDWINHATSLDAMNIKYKSSAHRMRLSMMLGVACCLAGYKEGCRDILIWLYRRALVLIEEK